MLGISDNENYRKIKRAAKDNSITLAELSKEIGMTRQNLYNRVHTNTLKKKYVQKLEEILGIEYDRFSDETGS